MLNTTGLRAYLLVGLVLGGCFSWGVSGCDREATAVEKPVAELAVSPTSLTLPVGQTQQLTATARDAKGNVLTGRIVTWSSSNTSVATVSESGLVTGVGSGTATITATSEGRTGSAAVTVPTYTLSVAKGGTGSGTVTSSPAGIDCGTACDGSIASGMVVTLTATAAAGSMFTGWSGDCTGTNPTCQLTMSQARSVTATFSLLGVGFGPEQFTLIPAGTFQLGDMVGSGALDERPVHLVQLTKAFYIQRTEVTQGQWAQVMGGGNPSHFSACGHLCPVESVSWDDIQVFLWLLNNRYPGRNYRLPTEAEWEYAARAGTTGDYGGTGVLDQMGWYWDNSAVGGVRRTHPVAQKLPNHWGLFDMHGNVEEWVQDWYGFYTVGPKTDPTGPATGVTRVLRGGSWSNFAGVARSAFRNFGAPGSRNCSYGFRLARTE